MKNDMKNVMNWIIYDMVIGREYNLSEKQMELIGNVMEAFIIPTIPCDEYSWYLEFGEGYETVKKKFVAL